jgi:hypothetical protein
MSATNLELFSDIGLRAREFILSTYNNLPNTIFVTALLLGAIQGNLSMIWIAIGMIINALCVLSLQELLSLIFPKWDQVHQPSSRACSLIDDPLGPALTVVAPSYWFASTTYFVTFILYNAAQVAFKPANHGVSKKKVDKRVAFTMSVMILSLFFLLIIMLRGLTGCETWLGSILGISAGSTVAILYWHLLDVCHSGIAPDILNMVSGLAPSKRDDDNTPVICTA